MTEQKKKLLKAKIAAALYHENGKVPSREEIEKWTKFAKVLYTAVLGLHFERTAAEERQTAGDLLRQETVSVFSILFSILDIEAI